MPVTTNEHLILMNKGMEMEFYLNDQEEIFCTASGDEELAARFFFTFSKEDWEIMKEFVDRQFLPF